MTDIATRARKIIVEHLGVEASAVTDTADIIDDLGADSLDTVELILAFEEAFGIEISDDDAEAVKTVGDLIAAITREHDKAARSFGARPRGGGIPTMAREVTQMVTPNDLIIFTDEDGYPWAAFVWGEADPQDVAALITVDGVEDATGYSKAGLDDLECSWPPNVKAYWLKALGDETYQICDESDEGAQRITGHRFYAQG